MEQKDWKKCDICDGEYPESKHNFEECYSLDIEWDLRQMGAKLRVCSFFCGCGGMDFDFHKNDRFIHVYSNDMDKNACATYENYFGFAPECKSIKKLTNVPDCDVMTGGFPCQGFSIANMNRNEGDERNELYKELVRMLKLKKPKYFIFENVKGILSLGGYANKEMKKARRGRVFNTIVKDFEECGYNVYTKLFKMKWYGIHQNRERVIFIGVKKPINTPVIWPIETKKITCVLRDAIGDLPADFSEENQHIGTKQKVKVTGHIGNRILKMENISPTITGNVNIHPNLTRRMSVRECARIQTFPDNFIFTGSISSMYRQIGNAVPPKFSSVLTSIILSIEDRL